MRPVAKSCCTSAQRRTHIARKIAAAALLFAGAISLGGCGKSKPPDAIERGRIIYVTRCIICHNADPNRPGMQGPAVAGASRALLEARVLHLAYPPGYKPKRTTHSMRAFPNLSPHDLDYLAAYLKAVAEPSGARQ
jgi:mono/diheme cytochrome c family protein